MRLGRRSQVLRPRRIHGALVWRLAAGPLLRAAGARPQPVSVRPSGRGGCRRGEYWVRRRRPRLGIGHGVVDVEVVAVWSPPCLLGHGRDTVHGRAGAGDPKPGLKRADWSLGSILFGGPRSAADGAAFRRRRAGAVSVGPGRGVVAQLVCNRDMVPKPVARGRSSAADGATGGTNSPPPGRGARSGARPGFWERGWRVRCTPRAPRHLAQVVMGWRRHGRRVRSRQGTPAPGPLGSCGRGSEPAWRAPAELAPSPYMESGPRSAWVSDANSGESAVWLPTRLHGLLLCVRGLRRSRPLQGAAGYMRGRRRSGPRLGDGGRGGELREEDVGVPERGGRSEAASWQLRAAEAAAHRLETTTNSSKEMTPSPSLSVCRMMVSALRMTSSSLPAMWLDLRILTSSCLVMAPLPSSSKTVKAKRSFSSLDAPQKLDSAIMNSRKSMWPLFSLSNSENSRSTAGDGSTCMTSQNSA